MGKNAWFVRYISCSLVLVLILDRVGDILIKMFSYTINIVNNGFVLFVTVTIFRGIIEVLCQRK